MMGNAAAAAVAMRHGLHGHTYGVVSACAAGAHALGDAAADHPRRRRRRGRRRRRRGGDHRRRHRRLRGDGSDLADRHLAPLRRPPRRLRDGRGRRRPRARGDGGRASARRRDPRRAARLRRHLRRLPPDRAAAGRRPRRRGRSASRSPTPGSTAVDVDYVNAHGTSTPLNDRSETLALKLGARRARRRHPGQLDQVGDRPPARRRRRGRGDRDDRSAAPPRGAADGRLGRARRGPRPRLRARHARNRSRTATGPLVAISNSFGFGGHNAVLCLGRLMSTATVKPPAPGRGRDAAGAARGALRPRQLPAPAQRRLLGRGSASAPRPGDGVVAGAGEVGGRPVFCYSQDPTFLGGSLGEVHADTIVRLLRMAGDAGAPVVGFVRSGGARLQEGHAALAGYGRIFRASVELSRKVPQISVVSGVSAGGGAYSPALTDFVVMTDGGADVPHRPQGRRSEALGEEISMEDARRPARARPQRRLPPGRRRRRRGDRGDPPPARPAAAGDRRAAAEIVAVVDPDGRDPGAHRPRRAAQGLRRPRRRRLDPRRGHLPRALAALGAEHGHRDRPSRRPLGRPDRQPAAGDRRRDRRRRRREGGPLRRLLRPLRAAARRLRRHPRVPARQAPGGAGRDPPRRLAAARLRRRLGAESDAGPAQGLRRRRDHDELQRPRRRRRLLLARRSDRDHGRPPGGRDRPPPGAEGGRRRLARRARRRLRGRAPDRAGRRRQRLGRRGDRSRLRAATGSAGRCDRWGDDERCRPCRRSCGDERDGDAARADRLHLRRSRRQLHRRPGLGRRRALGRPPGRRPARGQPGADLPQPRGRRRRQRRRAGTGPAGARA